MIFDGADDSFVDSEMRIAIGESEAAFESEGFAAQFPLGDFNERVAFPVVRVIVFGAPLRVGYVGSDAATAAAEAHSRLTGARVCFDRCVALEGLRRDWFVQANLLDREGVTGPGDFIFCGTPVADVDLAAHDHMGGGVDPEQPAICWKFGVVV